MWKNITGWEGLYAVNENGEVKNLKTGRLIVGDHNSCGYERVTLYNKKHDPSKQRFFRHRLVASVFLENTDGYKEVNHIDHNLKNNHVSNLEWCSRKQNELDSRISGDKLYRPFIVIYNDGRVSLFDTKPELADVLDVSRSLVRLWLCGDSKTYDRYGIQEIKYFD